MAILLGFSPFIIFAVLSRFVSPALSLSAAAATSGLLLVRERLRGQSLKILEAGTFLLFSAIALFAFLAKANWDIPLVRTMVDSGLLLIILISLAVKKPFTLQYAREQAPPEVRQSPAFLRTNYVISAVWAVALAVVVAADISMHASPDGSHKAAVFVIIAALYGAFWFTKWYPQQLHKRSA